MKTPAASKALFVTERCQNSCVFCFVRSGGAAANVLGTREAISSLDRLAARDAGAVDFLGGEPLLHPDFFGIAEAAASRGLRINVTTNALALADAGVARRLLPLIGSLVVSIHAGDARSYAAVTGNAGGFRLLRRALQVLEDCRGGARVMFNTTVTGISLGTLGGVLKLIEPYAGARWDLTNLFPLGRGLERYAGLAPRISDLRGVLPEMAGRAAEAGISARFSFFPACAFGYDVQANNDARESGRADGHRVDRRLNPGHRGSLVFKRGFGRRCGACQLKGSGCSGVASRYLAEFGESELLPRAREGGAR